MIEILKTARLLTKRGYSIIPVGEDKNPSVKNWSTWQTVSMTIEEVEKHFKRAYGIGLLGGGKNNITIVDWDTKYDLTGTLYEDAMKIIPAHLYKKMLVNRSKSGGHHWIFSCPKGVGNIKLAQRETSEEEVRTTLEEELTAGKGIKEAMKIAQNDKCRVLIETRSFTSTTKADGTVINKSDGYALFPPTPGYEHIEGKIGEITPQELEELFQILRSFNTFAPPKIVLKNTSLGNDIWEKANNQLSTIEMLTECGWKIVFEGDTDVRLLRPGQVSSTTSAIYHKDTKVLVVFSSSTLFEPGKGMNPAQVFIELECEGDVFLAKQKLSEILN